jgi:capsular polysaccharide biosynthesis protein/Mrp family chromosome partitioning ATPase
MDAPTAPQTTRLHVRTSLYAHRALIAICAIAGTLAGVAATGLLPTTYGATASVLVQPLDGNPYSPNAQGSDLTNLETEAQVVASDVIAANVKQALLDDNLPANARKSLRIAVAPNTQIVTISYTGQAPEVVEATALQYANSYLDFRSERRDAFIDSKREAIAERIDTLSEDLRRFRREDREADDPEVRSVGAQQTNLRLQLAGLDTADSNPGEVITTPTAAKAGLSVPWQLGALAGLLLGLAAGAILALVLERRSELLRTVDDIEHLGVAVLGSHANGDDEDASVDSDAEVPYDVANLAGTILNRRSDMPATIAVSSLSGASSVSTFTNDLALVLSHGREGVLLIDAASDIPTKTPGFSEVLAGTSELKAALVKRVRGKPVDPVARIRIGKNPTKGFSLYSTSRMSDALEAAAAEYNWVLVESPGSDQTTGRAVVGACHYWIPVVELGVATRQDLEKGLAWARTTGVETLGVVVVNSQLNIFGRAKRREPEPDSGE